MAHEVFIANNGKVCGIWAKNQDYSKMRLDRIFRKLTTESLRNIVKKYDGIDEVVRKLSIIRNCAENVRSLNILSESQQFHVFNTILNEWSSIQDGIQGKYRIVLYGGIIYGDEEYIQTRICELIVSSSSVH